MYENEARPQRALLVSLDTGEYDAEASLAELEEAVPKNTARAVYEYFNQKTEEPS